MRAVTRKRIMVLFSVHCVLPFCLFCSQEIRISLFLSFSVCVSPAWFRSTRHTTHGVATRLLDFPLACRMPARRGAACFECELFLMTAMGVARARVVWFGRCRGRGVCAQYDVVRLCLFVFFVCRRRHTHIHNSVFVA